MKIVDGFGFQLLGCTIFLTFMGCNSIFADEPVSVGANEALQIANGTAHARAFLQTYGHCDGCNPDYAEGVRKHVGCVQYDVKDACDGVEACDVEAWRVSYYLGDLCHFRYGVSWEEVVVMVGKDGAILSTTPDLEYVTDSKYCRGDEDCRCLSGSGREFMGCANDLHASTWFAGSYECEKCHCVQGTCSQ